MIYTTVKQSPIYYQMSLEEFLFNVKTEHKSVNYNPTNTRTYVSEQPNPKLLERTDVAKLIEALTRYNELTSEIRNKKRETLYNTFYVEKKGKGMHYVIKQLFKMQNKYIECNTSEVFKAIATKTRTMLSEHPTELDDEITKTTVEYCVTVLAESGFKISSEEFKKLLKNAYRRIDAPKEELKAVLYQLKAIFEDVFGVLHHTTAFAYVKNRSTLDALKRHQANKSKWFGKYDLSNFFGSTNVEFIIKMFSMIFPFSEVVKYPIGKEALETALSLCTLKDVLPQGTPISPLITNVMMIPIDHKLSNTLKEYNEQHYVYTRYADDFLISSRYDFNFKEIEALLVSVLNEFGAPFSIKSEKTRYGSSSGSNWNLGVMLNKENKITVGYKKKRQFQAMLSSYIMDRKNGIQWDKNDVQVMEGYRNYYKMVEGDTIDRIVEHIGRKFGVNIIEAIKADLSA